MSGRPPVVNSYSVRCQRCGEMVKLEIVGGPRRFASYDCADCRIKVKFFDPKTIPPPELPEARIRRPHQGPNTAPDPAPKPVPVQVTDVERKPFDWRI